LLVKDITDLQDELKHTDILIVATGANQAVITTEDLPQNKNLLIFDLSIPKNVNEKVAQMPGVDLVHLDQLSKVTDDTLESRKLQIPIAEQIINEVYAEYKVWLESRKIAPTLKALKAKLADLKELEIKSNRSKIQNFNQEQAEVLAERIIQKITGHFANHLKENGSTSDETLQLIHQVFKLEPVEA
ncbi:MAG: glutamyl-tRNA reductase, partial [Flavobacteriaceae bacterium]|nr:glutamyl-tRNA reductase [Flavobacteriaceae bacterium]